MRVNLISKMFFLKMIVIEDFIFLREITYHQIQFQSISLVKLLSRRVVFQAVPMSFSERPC